MTGIELTSILANISTVLGIPIAIILYLNEKRKERIEREYGTYNALDEKYLEYLQLCITYPKLDLYYFPLGKEPSLTNEEKIQQYAMCEQLISLMERAFLMYKDQSTEIKKDQWIGWNQYMHDWGGRATFQNLWKKLGYQFDEAFVEHMNTIIAKNSPSIS